MKSKKLISIWVRVLKAAQEGKTEKERERMNSRLRDILKAKKKAYLLPRILEETDKALRKANIIELTLAREAGRDTLAALEKKLKEFLGPEKKVETKIDEAIIGGFTAKTEDRLIDASLKDYLSQLKKDALAAK